VLVPVLIQLDKPPTMSHTTGPVSDVRLDPGNCSIGIGGLLGRPC
jgi:hypothetical protein